MVMLKRHLIPSERELIVIVADLGKVPDHQVRIRQEIERQTSIGDWASLHRR